MDEWKGMRMGSGETDGKKDAVGARAGLVWAEKQDESAQRQG